MLNDATRAQLPRVTLLAPDIVEAILDGRQPEGMRLDELLDAFPLDWAFQLIGKRRHRHPGGAPS